MKKLAIFSILTICAFQICTAQSGSKMLSLTKVKVENGLLEGVKEASGIISYKGIPFAAPPVGDLRWREPQPAPNWTGVRKADQFGAKAMQLPIFGDMNFRAPKTDEDCLYLNVWSPAKSATDRLPVLVYFYGGGFLAGDGSEPRYDGENMAKKGIITLTVNYRLGIFGFFSHPELTVESQVHSSGNYGYLDQNAALKWVQKNIAAFGGDPNKVTIAGESAGSASVSAQMISPLSKGLFRAAIGESGSVLGTLPPSPIKVEEQKGSEYAKSIHANTLKDLRNIPANELLQLTGKPGTPRFSSTMDGYFFTETPIETFKKGLQSKVPLLAGWNSAEIPYNGVLGSQSLTLENYTKAVQNLYGNKAVDALKVYQAKSDQDVEKVATDLASDRFIAFSTWKWMDMHLKTGNQPVYRYIYSRPMPLMTAEMGNATPGLAGGIIKNDKNVPKPKPAIGARHACEIEYAMGNLASNKAYTFTADDYKVSATMLNYFANFIKTLNPNGKGLPVWSALKTTDAKVMIIDVKSQQVPEPNRSRYLFQDQFFNK